MGYLPTFKNCQRIFLGENTSKEFADKHKDLFDHIYDQSKTSQKEQNKIIKSCNYAVIVMDHSLAHNCYLNKIRFYFVDSLFGFWSLRKPDDTIYKIFSKLIVSGKKISSSVFTSFSVHERKVLSHFLSEASFIQTSLKNENRFKSYKKIFPKKTYFISPICDIKFLSNLNKKIEKNTLLINLGGIRNFVIKANSTYEKLITKLAKDLLGMNIIDNILICSGSYTKTKKEVFNKKVIKYSFLDKNKFLQQINESKLIMSSPGLTAIYELLLCDKPAIFIPEQHSSQLYNMRDLKSTFLRRYTLSFFDIIKNKKISKNDYKGSKQIIDLAEKFYNDEKYYKKLKDEIIKKITILVKTNKRWYSKNSKKLIKQISKNTIPYSTIPAIIEEREISINS